MYIIQRYTEFRIFVLAQPVCTKPFLLMHERPVTMAQTDLTCSHQHYGICEYRIALQF